MSEPVVHEPLEGVPEGCTCIWAVMVNDDGEELCGNVCISMGDECPAWPHWRSWSRPPHNGSSASDTDAGQT